ncbi:MAG TPA: serine/threonine-protein kinase [Vicinamibacterales bacterium]|nr:serine/threonine-protein kinase [Vicinamibacterales bacterium]
MQPGTGAAAARRMPSKIGAYRIVDRIGKGAMGVVYSAHDDRAGRPVAVKVMMADLEGDRETRERFYREAKIAGRLQHRNLITVYDMGEEEGRLYMVMELLEGQTLAEFLKRPEPIPLEQTVDLMMQMCEGLAVAHVHGIVHRDIKPGNLFIKNDGTLKILDFGVARLADSNMTASGFIVGTPDFMSPEQARGRDIDRRSDIFSTGAVFYYMLSGRKPFAANDLPAVLNKVENEDPPPLTEAEAPEALSRIIFKALSKQVTRRHQELGELLADLTRFQREYDRESREMALKVRQRALRLQARLARGEGGGEDDGELFSLTLRERYPVLEDRGPDALGVVPFRRQAVREIQAEIESRLAALDAARGQPGAGIGA